MFRRRTALSVSATAALLAATPLLAACGNDARPGAAAIVDGKRITVSQLQAKVKDVRAAQAKSPQGGQLVMSTGRLSLATLNGMIFDEVLARGAHDAGVTVSRGDIQKWRGRAEKQAGSAERLKAMWLQQGVAPDEIDAMVRNQLLLDGVAEHLHADRRAPEGQQKLARALAKTSRSMGIDVNPRFGKWDDQQVILGETKDPWITREPAKQQARPPPPIGVGAVRYVRGVNADASASAAGTGADARPEGAGTGRLVLLTTSHRVAPGLLSWPAWQILRAADRVVSADPDHPQLPYLREAGIEVETAAPAARELVDYCVPEARTAVVLTSADGESALTDGLARLAGSGRETMPDLELLPGSYDLPGARLLDLVQVMDQIRAECPWSSVRTHRDLAKYGIEEAYELVEAIEEGDRAELREELGDVLLQVVFHARIAQDDPDEPFSIDDVAGTIVEKLLHRHPHVFGEAEVATPEEVRAQWLRKKAEEKQRESVTEGIPLAQPGLALAAKLASRVRTAGIEVAPPTGEGIGYELLALAVRAEADGVDPEAALRAAARAYRDAVVAAESSAH